MQINRTYITSDLALSAFLSLYFPLDSVDKTDSSKVNFIFLRSAELEDLVEAYWKRKVQVNPQDYFNAVKNVKNRLYQE